MEILQVRNWENGGGSKSALPPIVPRSCKGILGLIEGRHYLSRSHPGSPPVALYFFRYLLVSHLLNPSMQTTFVHLAPPSFQSETVELWAPFETAEHLVTALPSPPYLPQILASPKQLIGLHREGSMGMEPRWFWSNGLVFMGFFLPILAFPFGRF